MRPSARGMSTWAAVTVILAGVLLLASGVGRAVHGWPDPNTIAWLAVLFILAAFAWLAMEQWRTRHIRRTLDAMDREVRGAGGWHRLTLQRQQEWLDRLSRLGR